MFDALGSVECPDGFDVKATIGGRQGEQREAFAPDFRFYSAVRPYVCFRSLDEAAAWRYVDAASLQYATPTSH